MANLNEKTLILDPKGYFLIRLLDSKIEIGFCSYKDMQLGVSNVVLKKFSSTSIEDILDWVKKNKLYSLASHYDYLVSELNRAALCLKSGKEYVQK